MHICEPTGRCETWVEYIISPRGILCVECDSLTPPDVSNVTLLDERLLKFLLYTLVQVASLSKENSAELLDR